MYSVRLSKVTFYLKIHNYASPFLGGTEYLCTIVILPRF